MILIVGGSGALGSLITRRLLAAGDAVRVMTRSPDKAAALRAAGAEIVRGDLLDRSSLIQACAGARALVAAAHSFLGRGRSASIHVDGEAHRQLIDIARSAGVRYVVYLSVYDFGPACHALPFFRSKFGVERHLAASGLQYTILRPTAFMESHVHDSIGAPILATGKVTLFGRGELARNFVAADDVAQLVALALRDGSMTGETVEIGGPGNFTHMEVVRMYERASGRDAAVTHVPLGVLRALHRPLRLLHPGLSQLLQAGILMDTAAQSFDAGPLTARFPIALTRLEEWISRRVEASD